MKSLHVEWVHGWDARPWGAKSTALKQEAELRAVSMGALDYQAVRDPEQRAELLARHLRELDRTHCVALAGSSMGGYVSLLACRQVPVRELWLLCPALHFPELLHREFPWVTAPVTVIHGWEDECVPVESSFDFAREHGARLHVMHGDHRFSGRLEDVRSLFAQWLEHLLHDHDSRCG